MLDVGNLQISREQFLPWLFLATFPWIQQPTMNEWICTRCYLKIQWRMWVVKLVDNCTFSADVHIVPLVMLSHSFRQDLLWYKLSATVGFKRCHAESSSWQVAKVAVFSFCLCFGVYQTSSSTFVLPSGWRAHKHPSPSFQSGVLVRMGASRLSSTRPTPTGCFSTWTMEADLISSSWNWSGVSFAFAWTLGKGRPFWQWVTIWMIVNGTKWKLPDMKKTPPWLWTKNLRLRNPKATSMPLETFPRIALCSLVVCQLHTVQS